MQSLVHEHEVISEVLESLEGFLVAIKICADGDGDGQWTWDAMMQDLEGVVQFMEQYVDGMHHVKEDNILFQVQLKPHVGL